MTKDKYTAEQITVLEGLEPVRKRPGMYIGSTDSRGLHECLREIVDNSVDESFAGVADSIWVTLNKDGSATVKDNGRGIPVDKHKSGVSALELTMTKLHAGGKFGGGAYKVSGGLHGVGASVVNALSSYFRVVVLRDGKAYFQEYKEGKPFKPVSEISFENLKKWGIEADKNDTGTITTFIPDKKVFENVTFDNNKCKSLLRDRAYLVAGLYFHFKDENDGDFANFYFEGGIKSLVAHSNRGKTAVSDVIYVSKEEGGISCEVAIQYTDSFSENVKGYVNGINTVDGGTHVTGFRTALTRAITDYAKKLNGNGNGKEDENLLVGEDMKEGLTSVVYIKMPSDRLQFESQTKAKLNNPEVQTFTAQTVKEGLDTYFEEHPADARKVVEKVTLSAKARLAARAAKDAVLRKGALEGAALPGLLADCQSNDPSISELYIVEGPSAGGCFSANTKIALADGRDVSFKELVREYKLGKRNYCYTTNKNGSIEIAEIKNPRLTKKNAKVIKVILDNNQKIICTPDHLFRLRNGSYKKASELIRTDSLMPLRKKLSKIEGRITIKGYEMVFDPYRYRWIFTHVLSDRYNIKNNPNYNLQGEHKHHIDFNKLNNNPDNIARFTKDYHLKLHSQQAYKTLQRPDVLAKLAKLHGTKKFREKIRKAMTTPTMRKLLSDRAKLQWQNETYKKYMTQKYMEFYNNNTKYREQNNKRLFEAQKDYWSKSENHEYQSKINKDFFKKHPERKLLLRKIALKEWQDKNLLAWRSETTKKQWTSEFRKKRKEAYNKTYLNRALSNLHSLYQQMGNINIDAYQNLRLTSNDKTLLKYETIKNRFFDGSENRFQDAVVNFNHKIKQIVQLNKRIDVYDLEVDETHNFALASGVFVHNSAKMGRDRKYQAILPLGGKILNTERAHLDKIVKFDEIKNLIIALGGGIGETLNYDKFRYHRVIIMCDADVDGEHITTLLLTFFFRHMPELINRGYLYIALPPLYKITFGKEIFYAYDDAEKDLFIKEKVKGVKYGLQRYKGLGEMNPQQLWETTMDPEKRTLKKVSVESAEEADKLFTMLMGEEVPPRKKFIQTNAHLATLDV